MRCLDLWARHTALEAQWAVLTILCSRLQSMQAVLRMDSMHHCAAATLDARLHLEVQVDAEHAALAHQLHKLSKALGRRLKSLRAATAKLQIDAGHGAPVMALIRAHHHLVQEAGQDAREPAPLHQRWMWCVGHSQCATTFEACAIELSMVCEHQCAQHVAHNMVQTQQAACPALCAMCSKFAEVVLQTLSSI